MSAVVDFLRPLAPLGGGSAPGLTADSYQALRQRQALADNLAKGAMTNTGAGGSALSAVSQGVMGLASALMRGQNQADIGTFAQASPMAAVSLQAGQPQSFDLSASLGRVFGRLGFGGEQSAQPGFLTPDPDNRAGASLSSTPTVGTGWERDDDA